MLRTPSIQAILLPVITLVMAACNSEQKPVEKDIAVTPEELSEKTVKNIRRELDYAGGHNGNIGDSIFLSNPALVSSLYGKEDFKPLWSEMASWKTGSDSLVSFIKSSRLFGLFPDDYHSTFINAIHDRIAKDTAGKTDSKDAALWSRVDILMTDAFLHLVKDIKLGRLPNDSVSLRRDSVVTDETYSAKLTEFRLRNNITALMSALEPKHQGYQAIKASLAAFLEHSNDKEYTKVPPMKENPAAFRVALQKRLYEGGYLATDTVMADSAQVADAVKAFQKDIGIGVDGQAGSGTLRSLNLTDHDRFVSAAITMDRYKLLPETMPERYIWVNLPGYYMQLRDRDSVKIYSKIICGKPQTRTPLLNSNLSDLVTFPQWTIPSSIIEKEILPAAKKSPGYFAKKGFSLIDGNGDEVDPYEVDWSKYKKGIPYRVVQGSGDDNALGILKFNFPNKFAVYLHDTNQRYLFAQAMRSLSHGCVRVQQWKDLAYQLVRWDNGQDGENEEEQIKASPTEDSMSAWLERKEKHSIRVRQKMPVYIRYFTCEGKNGKLVFFDDIYGEDRILRQRYFARK
ncbi:MAG: hypothetical protein EOO09_07200 [Chitinophagaceae bacterium]|nr:MAG: hypothetical protein EOO09_07200 [Chitinophagaceae bacterium]